MNNIELINVYYQENKSVTGYMDIFLETNIGFLKHNVTSLNITEPPETKYLFKVNNIPELKNKYGKLYIIECRLTYDNNMYLLLSGIIILAIEYILNPNLRGTIQEIRFIEFLDGINICELNDFKDLDIIPLPIASI